MLLPLDLLPDIIIESIPSFLAIHVGWELPEHLLHRFDQERISEIHDIACHQIHVDEIHEQSLELILGHTDAK
jgi:hypothetical protein